MKLELMPVSESDADELVALRISTMRESLERLGRFDPMRARERFLSGFSPNDSKHIVSDGRRVGFVVVKTNANALLLDHLYVDPRYQGGGIGTWVLHQVFLLADQVGQEIRVGALKESSSNRFYTRHGFELVEVGDWDNYYVRKPKQSWQC